jgi:FtsZ-binding cell division protein ZapB
MAAILVTVLGMGYWYYNSSQATIATLRENNAQLEVAVQTATDSLKTMQEDVARINELNLGLQNDLKKAEEYGDDLRAKLREHNLTALAIKKPGLLEGRMNGATANLWRDITSDTGGDGTKPLPSWLQSVPERTGDQDSSQTREDNNTDSSSSEASPAG